MKLTPNMRQAVQAVLDGSSVPAVAPQHGVSEQGLYRALRRNGPKCPVCGSQRRSAAGLIRDYLSTRS